MTVDDRIASPPLDEEEWSVLLDLYMRRRPDSLSSNDPDLLELSRQLSRRASGAGKPQAQWRTPDGLRARTSVFRVLDPTVETVDSKRTSVSDRVWAKFSSDPEGLAAEAANIRARWQAGTIASFEPTESSNFKEPSRGPSAWAGSYHVDRLDGDCWVYLLVLAEEGHPPEPTGKVFFKIGRSGDLDRRKDELNWGFPPGFGFQWRIVEASLFNTESDAAQIEKSVLSGFSQERLCLGGEFVKSEFGAARDLFNRLARVERFSP